MRLETIISLAVNIPEISALGTLTFFDKLKTSDNVFNLSNKLFTGHEIKLLSRGLEFVPTPNKINRWQSNRI